MGQALDRYVTRIRLHSVGTAESQRNYVRIVNLFLRWLERSDDELIGELQACRTLEERGTVLQEHVFLAEKWGGELLKVGRARSTVNIYFTCLKAFYEANGYTLSLKGLRRIYTVNRDRAPTPDELRRMIDCAGSAKTRFILSALAFGGFRQGTLAQLRYKHVKEDLERGIVPCKVIIPRELTKGKVRDYVSFLGEEATEYLKIYLNERRQGALRYDGEGMPPEEITDETILLRNPRVKEVVPCTTHSIWKMVHITMIRTGLINRVEDPEPGTRYSMRPHSLRKFFKTQLEAAGVPRDFVEFMMGHLLPGQDESYFRPTVEQLREWYEKADLRIRPSVAVAEELRDQMLIERIEKEYEVPRSMIEGFVMKLRVEEKTQALREPEVLREWFKREMIRRETVLSKRDWVERETVDRE